MGPHSEVTRGSQLRNKETKKKKKKRKSPFSQNFPANFYLEIFTGTFALLVVQS
jgi:hypothetical protein